MNSAFRYAIALFAALTSFAAAAEIPVDYYSKLHGKSGAELKTAIHQVIAKDADITMLSFGAGTNATWWGFYLTDRDESDNSVVDRYSFQKFYYGTRGTSVSGMDIEHSFAKSWWGGAENNGYKDLFNLMPAESSINRSKSDAVMGKVVKVTTAAADNGCTKVGFPTNNTSDAKQKVWEPGDQWKGDFARSYLYMATAYQDYEWTGDQAPRILVNGDYPTLKPEASDLYMSWSKSDPVSVMEVVRNGRVKSIQGNRNPYIDFPNLMEYVWGDSIDVPFNVYTTVKSAPFSGKVVGDDEVKATLFECDFKSQGNGGCKVEHTIRPSAIGNVWTFSAQSGWIGVASKNKGATSYKADARLVTPEIDLTHYHNCCFTFEHSVNYDGDLNPSARLSVAVRTADGAETPIGEIRWPHGNSTAFYPTHRGYLNRFAGQKVNLVFHYTSDETVGPRWAIRNLRIVADGYSPDAVRPIVSGDVNSDGVVNVADITTMVDVILTSAAYSPASDVNEDFTVNIADITTVADLILTK